MKLERNASRQEREGVPLELATRRPEPCYDAGTALNRRLNGAVRKAWTPEKRLEEDGTLKAGENIDCAFFESANQVGYAGPFFDKGAWKRHGNG